MDDTSLVAQLGARAFYEAFAAQTPEHDLAVYLQESFAEENVHAEILDTRAVFLIADVSGNEAAGYAKLHAGEPPASVTISQPIQLQRLYLLRRWWGSGVADVLMERCIAEASQQGYHAIWLSSWEKNARANRFYQKWSFERVGQADFVVGNDIQHDEILLRIL